MSILNSETNLSASSESQSHILEGNRQLISDHYVASDIVKQGIKYKVFTRLYAKEKTFDRVSFEHCIFDNCYLTYCTFNSCDFTGCKFIGSNFRQSAFKGCDFKYAIFERSQFDDDILVSEVPSEENYKMHFARSLRMNYQQIGDVKAVNKAISVELEATAIYLRNSWCSRAHYYSDKFPKSSQRLVQFLRWLKFSILDFIWGNGESIAKLVRSIFFMFLLIAIFHTYKYYDWKNLVSYWKSFQLAPAIFLGVFSPDEFSEGVLALVAAAKLISFSLLTALLVKRFSRR